MKTGTILLSRNNGWLGKLIRLRSMISRKTGKVWGHASIIVGEFQKDGEKYWRIAEALTQGFVITPYEKWWVKDQIEKGKYLPGETKIKIKDPLKIIIEKNYVGRPYAWLDIFNIAIIWIFGKYAKKISTGARALICSEAVARILYDASNKKINFEEEFDLPYDEIEPYHLGKSEQIKWEK